MLTHVGYVSPCPNYYGPSPGQSGHQCGMGIRRLINEYTAARNLDEFDYYSTDPTVCRGILDSLTPENNPVYYLLRNYYIGIAGWCSRYYRQQHRNVIVEKFRKSLTCACVPAEYLTHVRDFDQIRKYNCEHMTAETRRLLLVLEHGRFHYDPPEFNCKIGGFCEEILHPGSTQTDYISYRDPYYSTTTFCNGWRGTSAKSYKQEIREHPATATVKEKPTPHFHLVYAYSPTNLRSLYSGAAKHGPLHGQPGHQCRKYLRRYRDEFCEKRKLNPSELRIDDPDPAYCRAAAAIVGVGNILGDYYRHRASYVHCDQIIFTGPGGRIAMIDRIADYWCCEHNKVNDLQKYQLSYIKAEVYNRVNQCIKNENCCTDNAVLTYIDTLYTPKNNIHYYESECRETECIECSSSTMAIEGHLHTPGSRGIIIGDHMYRGDHNNTQILKPPIYVEEQTAATPSPVLGVTFPGVTIKSNCIETDTHRYTSTAYRNVRYDTHILKETVSEFKDGVEVLRIIAVGEKIVEVWTMY